MALEQPGNLGTTLTIDWLAPAAGRGGARWQASPGRRRRTRARPAPSLAGSRIGRRRAPGSTGPLRVQGTAPRRSVGRVPCLPAVPVHNDRRAALPGPVLPSAVSRRRRRSPPMHGDGGSSRAGIGGRKGRRARAPAWRRSSRCGCGPDRPPRPGRLRRGRSASRSDPDCGEPEPRSASAVNVGRSPDRSTAAGRSPVVRRCG